MAEHEGEMFLTGNAGPETPVREDVQIQGVVVSVMRFL